MEKLSQPPRRYTIEEYFLLEDKALDRHEFLDGVIVAMAGGSPEHSLICANVSGELRSPYFRHPDGGWRIDFAIGLESRISLRSVPAELPSSEIHAGINFSPATDEESDVPPPT